MQRNVKQTAAAGSPCGLRDYHEAPLARGVFLAKTELVETSHREQETAARPGTNNGPIPQPRLDTVTRNGLARANANR